MGVVPEHHHKIEPVIIHDDQKFNVWPFASALLIFLLFGLLFLAHRKNSAEIARMSESDKSGLVYNSHSPLFQLPSTTPPQLAKAASLHNTEVPSKPRPVESDSPDEVDPEDESNVTETPVAPTASGPEAIQLSDVQLASQDDGEGQEVAIGSATIYNPSQYPVTNFELYMTTGQGSYRLDTFEGSPDRPQALPSLTIAPGARITVSIMSNGVFTVTDANAAKTVTVNAIENGQSVSSHVLVN